MFAQLADQSLRYLIIGNTMYKPKSCVLIHLFVNVLIALPRGVYVGLPGLKGRFGLGTFRSGARQFTDKTIHGHVF